MSCEMRDALFLNGTTTRGQTLRLDKPARKFKASVVWRVSQI
jgi:hypothetical protein